MKKFATIASAALLAMSGLFGTACSTKANAVENECSSVKKTFNVTGFTEVDAGHQFEVDIKNRRQLRRGGVCSRRRLPIT